MDLGPSTSHPDEPEKTATVREWSPPDSLDFSVMEPEATYVVPARQIEVSDVPTIVFTESERMLPKLARAKGADLRFLPTGAERKFLSEYSADQVWELVLGVCGIWNEWILVGFNLWLSDRLRARGMSEEQGRDQTVKLKLAKWDRERGRVEGLEIEGSTEDVRAILRDLAK